MKLVNTLHSAAMEYYDLGKIARAKGHFDTFEDYIQKAYAIGTEAALRSQTDMSENDPMKAIYLRSVSWLAFDAGHFREARQWAKLAYAIAPNNYEKESLEKLLLKIETKIKASKTKPAIFGVLTSFDFETNRISIRFGDKKQYQIILLPNSFFLKIIPFYVGKVVEIEIEKGAGNKEDMLVDIRLAA